MESNVSLTWRERSHPPSRQRSCATCIKTKRRCDNGLPFCGRCRQRGLTCVYRGRLGRTGSSRRASSPQSDLAIIAQQPTNASTSSGDCSSSGGTTNEPDPTLIPSLLLEQNLDSVSPLCPFTDAALPDPTAFGFPLDEPPLGLIHQPVQPALLTSLLGLDEAEGWYASRGGVL
ncbi:hypothetical protein SODALDRAFT_142337 [Sodiomyces alkalinus F11]|uniref:Zn(2)-C6 fungal-type domain-containing protein n=1 Tax=Sodiomyces alkalinus (strain CBS 110278 / VKM F-3762 / F11) TaxID=1314773 RepID=A0A3N2PZP1_SODAK|nr:hypothetical protein SODALDRAFT_142337 [Sodiomyces alkalinus F11]ROT39952.1 hypothetical protein SODALDRAFT_142337 [Sodiomyces alkalinus F11]